MRVLHVVKTTEGGYWAARQVSELVRRGVEVHVALPAESGRFVPDWISSGAYIHIADLSFPARMPWKLRSVCCAARQLLHSLQPDIIHSHFFSTTMLLRHALRDRFPGPIVFQVAGPLHLEHGLYRAWDVRSAGTNDYWIGSSQCIVNHYLHAGIPRKRVFLSYYSGLKMSSPWKRTNFLRSSLGIEDRQVVVGNINMMYPPKWFLSQRIGLKCHELVIEALSIVTRARPDIVGVFVGGPSGGAVWYEARLRALAARKAGDRIRFTGFLPPEDIPHAWPDFDIAVHVPLSENCGGVPEPLFAGVPTIAGLVGGLPEVVIDGVTGKTIPSGNPQALAAAIVDVLSDLPRYREMARVGGTLVRNMFDLSRTGAEIHTIYRHILGRRTERPTEFHSVDFLQTDPAVR